MGIAETRTGHPKEAQENLERAFSNLDDQKIQIEAGLELIEIDTASAQLDKAPSVAAKLEDLAPRKFLNTSKALDGAIAGWRLFGEFVAQAGSPFTPSMLVNKSYALSSNMLWYPNVVVDPTAVSGGQNIDSWFNTNAFAAPAPGTFGTMGRNTVFGSDLSSVNMSLIKTFSFTERIKLEFSANATNVVNHPSFALPDKTIGPGHKGQITGTSVGARQMEMIVKLRF